MKTAEPVTESMTEGVSRPQTCSISSSTLVGGLDEPTHALSRTSRARLLGALDVVRAEPDIALLFVSHRADEVAALECDRVVRLEGRNG